MKKFSIDTMPLIENILFANDYNSKYVYSAITDPLFRYNNKSGLIEPYAAQSYEYSKNSKKLIVKLRDDLYYYDGTKVSSQDYYNNIKTIMNSKSYSKFVLDNLKKIEFDNKYLMFYLYKKDINFHKKLSLFNISNVKENITSGPYYIYKVNKYSLVLKRNNFFRKKIHKVNNNIICFEVNDGVNDINKFYNGNINLTNNTMFPIEKYNRENNLKISESYIFTNMSFGIKLLSHKNKWLRKFIMSLIDANCIANRLNNMYEPNNNFYVISKLNDSKKLIKNKLKKNVTLTFGYNDFYPNLLVANEIKNQLKSYGINLKIMKSKFELKNKHDLNLVLKYPDYISDESIILSKYFRLLCKSLRFNYYINKYNCTGSKKVLYKMNKYILKKSYEIPILRMKSIYLCDNNLNNFNHIEFNFEDL